MDRLILSVLFLDFVSAWMRSTASNFGVEITNDSIADDREVVIFGGVFHWPRSDLNF